MDPKCKDGDADKSDMPKISHKVLLLKEKVEVKYFRILPDFYYTILL